MEKHFILKAQLHKMNRRTMNIPDLFADTTSFFNPMIKKIRNPIMRFSWRFATSPFQPDYNPKN
jgi:hypothetical protein